MGSSAIREWQRGVVAIGVRKPNLPSSILNGTGFIVDLQAGLIVTCAHVVLGNFYDFAIGEDSGTGGLAIGVGGIHDGKQIEWRGRAELRYISRPPASYDSGRCRCNTPYGPQPAPQQRALPHVCQNCGENLGKWKGPPPQHWSITDGDNDRLDLAMLQLVELDGSPLVNPTALLAHGGYDARALSLGLPPSTLSHGDELVMLGYGQNASGSGAEQTATTMRGHYAGCYSSNGQVPGSLQSGDWRKVDMTILSGHSGGPIVNRIGEVVGWASMGNASLGHVRPIVSLVPALTSVLQQPCCDSPAGVTRDVTGGLRSVLQGAIAPSAFKLSGEELDRCRDAAARAEQSAQDAHHHEQGALAHALFGASVRDDAARQAASASASSERAASSETAAAISAQEARATAHNEAVRVVASAALQQGLHQVRDAAAALQA